MCGAIGLGITLCRGINWRAWLKIFTVASWEAQGIFYVWKTEWNWKWFCACKFKVTPLIMISGNKKMKEFICWYYNYMKVVIVSHSYLHCKCHQQRDLNMTRIIVPCGHLNLEFLLCIQRVPYHIKKMDFYWSPFIFKDICPKSMICLLYSQTYRIRNHCLRWEVTYSDM